MKISFDGEPHMVAIPRLTVRTEFGSVLAVPHRGVLLFRNVPYAAPPFGARRFLPPQPPAIWDGLRDGAEPGVGWPQTSFGNPLARYFDPKTQGEDALTLEVQTPELGMTGLPVMVWMHAGGFVTGAGSAQANDGYAFARDGIVHVSINYRLGIDGYAFLEDSESRHADNLGLRDQIAALEWVQRNIAFFGGDPGNVTIAGQSTGGVSVSYLLAAPAATGLFVRAISQSGSPSMAMDTDQARRIAARLGEIAGVAPISTELAKLDLDVYRSLTAQMMGEVYGSPGAWKVGNQIPVPFCGVTGTEMLPEPVVEGIARKHDSRVKILAGTTKDETSEFLTQSFGDLTLDSPLGQQMLRSFDADADTVNFYRTMAPEDASDMVILAAIATDIWARRPTRDMVEANAGDGFLYEFTWESPMLEPGSGSPQGIDIPFVNDDFENMKEVPRGARMLGTNPSEELAGSMHRSFVDFVKTGDPGWPAYTPEEPSTMRFGVNTAVLHTA